MKTKEELRIVFVGPRGRIYIEIRSDAVFIRENSMGYGHSFVTDALNTMNNDYSDYKLDSIETIVVTNLKFPNK